MILTLIDRSVIAEAGVPDAGLSDEYVCPEVAAADSGETTSFTVEIAE